MGIFVVLPGHAPLLSNLEIGPLTAVLPDGGKVSFALNGGFAQVLDDHVLILSKTIESDSDIDVERAERALQRAEERLKKPSESLDVARAEAALKRALTRLTVSGQFSRSEV
jgi:F-type H+-transporting ATPase subunit epsilon